MSSSNKISIIINNYNYGRFLKKAITSVLSQTVMPYEIILIDDGSTDDSLTVAEAFKGQIKVISKQNGGQASAFNTGFKASSGDWVWFLDADDWLEKDAVEKVLRIARPGISKIHGYLQGANEQETVLGDIFPFLPLSEGNVVKEIKANGGYIWPPTSGNIFSRWALEECMPMPEQDYQLCADLYICTNVALSGSIQKIEEPLGYYRIHGKNGFHGFRMDAKWLRNQGNNLLLAKSLTEDLMHTLHKDKTYNYTYGRRSLEILMVAYRFSTLKNNHQLSKKYLHSNWASSQEVRKLSGKERLVASIYWTVLATAPKRLVQFVMNLAIRKSKRAVAAVV